MVAKLDNFDRSILREMQKNANLSQRELAERVGLSQNACWRRLHRLREDGVITGQSVRIHPGHVELALTVFVMVRTRHHSREWLERFRKGVLAIPEVIDFYRIAGEYDYMLKIVARDMIAFDQTYQRLISGVELDAVTSHITMEAIADNRNLPV